MKTKYPRMFGLLAAVLLVASFVVPVSLMSPAPVEADPGICKWDALMTPNYLPLKNDLANADITDMVIGGDGSTILLTATYFISSTLGYTSPPSTAGAIPCIDGAGSSVQKGYLFYSNNNGISFTGTKMSSFMAKFWDLYQPAHSDLSAYSGACPPPMPLSAWPNVYSVAIAPDNPNVWAITTDTWVAGALVRAPTEVWITENAGSSWEITNLALTVPETIRTIDISIDYGGKRDIVVGTTTGAGDGEVYVIKSTGFIGWQSQGFNSVGTIVDDLSADFFAIKFSPTYGGDASLAVVYATTAGTTGTYYNVSLRDIDSNKHLSWASAAIEVVDPTQIGVANSPLVTELNKADLELPSDFSGQAASLRRAYISLDSYAAGAAKTTARDGIFRVDDTTIYVLMDTSGVPAKSIYSIAYFGTYASGKLLAGERKGFPCTATVPTWFTDSPTTCPIPCWYPALKPTTGASCNSTGAGALCPTPLSGQVGDGGAIVGWKVDGQIAFAGTGSNIVGHTPTWYSEWASEFVVANDESAFAISRNNGETWNQIAMIDTAVSKFTDVAPTPDCKTVYLASINTTTASCCNFDSVWRSSSNINVTSPYSPLPVGTFWERVLTRQSQTTCNMTLSTTRVDLLRLVPYCADPTGQIVAWAAYGKKAQAWSPDYGDYWANITPRDAIQDFCFESSTVMYNLSAGGKVQKLPYTGTAWSTMLPSVDTILATAHTIAAYPEGKVLVGAGSAFATYLYAASFSSNFNTDNPTFSIMSLAGKTTYTGSVHVAFDPNFKDNNTVFINDSATSTGSVYRNNVAAQLRWGDTDMMQATNGAVGCTPVPHQLPQYGLVLAFTGQALYSAHGVTTVSDNRSGVCRTIDDGTGKYGPLSGMPKPGVAWDCLNIFVSPPAASSGVKFTLEPASLKACGCCTLDTDTTLYAIDNNSYSATSRTGLVWAFTDCMAKRGPALVTEDKILIGCDPVSGRAQEVNLCWEQLCVANTYDIEIAKDATFTIRIIDWMKESDCYGFEPADVQTPCAFFPAGGASGWYEEGGSAIAAWGNLECGHTYYWRIKARKCATTQNIRSPWSEARSFTVKAGLPVVSTYLGLTLLAPNNGCLGCPVQPVSFSWSPFKETTKYKFQLASDAGMTQLVKEAEVVNTSAYEYDGALDYSTNYFWRVQSMEPAPSDWSATFSLQTEAKPAPITTTGGPTATPVWVWVVIAIGAILVIVTLVLIFKTRRV